MISASRRWFRRNRTGLAIGAGVIGVGYIAGQYVLSKIGEARERVAGDRIAKENLRRRFQQNQEDCTITVLELLPTVAENAFEALPAERISKEIQQKKAERTGRVAATSDGAPSDFSSRTPSVADEDGRSMMSSQSESYVHASQMGHSNGSLGDSRPQKTKVQLWTDLKIIAITRAFTLIYTLTLLTLLTRIQLNLLGRRSYLASVVSLASQSPNEPTIHLENHDDDNVERAYGNDFETNRRYLTFSWWLLHRGWRDIMSKVEVAVKEVFGSVKPTEDLPLDKLSSLILDVRKRVEGSTPEERKSCKWLPYLLPPVSQEAFVLRESGVSPPSPTYSTIPSTQDPTTIPSPPPSPPPSISSPPLRRLLDETSDLIDSPMFTHVLTLLLDTTFSQLIDQKIRSEAYKLPTLPTNSPAPLLPNSSRIEDITETADPATATAKLAIIMAAMTREARAIGSGVPNEYVQAMEGVSELEGFAAVVYSSNFEIEEGGGVGVGVDGVRDFSRGEGDAAGVSGGSQTLEEMSAQEAEDSLRAASSGSGAAGIMGSVTGVADSVWGGFESVWERTVGGSAAGGKGPIVG